MSTTSRRKDLRNVAEVLRISAAGLDAQILVFRDRAKTARRMARDLEAQAQGLIPGTRMFWVDMLDGRLWSRDEAAAFWRLSSKSQ